MEATLENLNPPKTKESSKPLRQPAEYGTLRRSILQKAKNAFNYINQSDTINIKHKSASDVAENIAFGDVGQLRQFADENKIRKAKDIGIYENQTSVSPLPREQDLSVSKKDSGKLRHSIIKKAKNFFMSLNEVNENVADTIAARYPSTVQENDILAKKDIDSPLEQLNQLKNNAASVARSASAEAGRIGTKARAEAARFATEKAGPLIKKTQKALTRRSKTAAVGIMEKTKVTAGKIKPENIHLTGVGTEAISQQVAEDLGIAGSKVQPEPEKAKEVNS